MNQKPNLRDRTTSSDRILGKVKDFVETFIDGMGRQFRVRKSFYYRPK